VVETVVKVEVEIEIEVDVETTRLQTLMLCYSDVVDLLDHDLLVLEIFHGLFLVLGLFLEVYCSSSSLSVHIQAFHTSHIR
jgi:hypothetical protein